MPGNSHQGAYGNPAWGSPPGGGWGGPPSGGPRDGAAPYRDWSDYRDRGFDPWHPAQSGRFLPIVAMILGFLVWWPVGLALLGHMVWSRRMGCWSRRAAAGMRGDQQGRGPSAEPWAGPWTAPWVASWRGWCSRRDDAAPASSGNRAFDEYRAETLRRLEQEQQEFSSFLDRLRFAKDKSEFDQFMAERRQAPPAAPEQPAAG